MVEEGLGACCRAKDLGEASLATTTGLFCKRGGGRHEDWKPLGNDTLRASLLAHDPTDGCKRTGGRAFMVGLDVLERRQVDGAPEGWRDMA